MALIYFQKFDTGIQTSSITRKKQRMPSAGIRRTPKLSPLLGHKKYPSLCNPKVEMNPS
jgi:hypothetical protein